MATLSRADLARLGFLAPERALAAFERLAGRHEGLADVALPLVGGVADPDLALESLAQLADADPELPRRLADPATARRVLAVLGASAALGRWLARRPADLAVLEAAPDRLGAAALRADLLAAVGADPGSAMPSASAPAAGDDLRHAYRRHLLRVAARDLTAADPAEALPAVAAELADLADATVEAALAVARAEVADSDQVRLAVVALGKTGAQELNYVSDVDVLYLAEPAADADGQPRCSPDAAIDIATRLVAALTRACSEQTAAGSIWPIDANLRPEGAAGPLVRSLAAMRRYYSHWASNWEFQAMLKARPMAGDQALGEAFGAVVGPLVWTAAQRDGFVDETQAMRARVVAHIPPRERDREIKLGAGGLRDTEFSVQLLQLVHGRTDERLRLRATLPALQALVDHGYIGRADGAALARAYRFQRLLEHRVQLYQLRRTHLMPDDADGLRRLARSVGLSQAEAVGKAWRESARVVQRLHQRVFYSPLLEAVARIPTEDIRLTADEAQVRLRALGYGDPAAALRHIEALSSGLSRRAEIQRQLLPAMLGWFAAGPNPDMGLLAFRQLSDALGNSPFYLRALRDEGATAERLARILATSRYATTLLRRAPAMVEALVGDPVAPVKERAALVEEMTAVTARRDETDLGRPLRAARGRELVRVAMADILGEADIRRVGRELSDITDAALEAALAAARREVPEAPEMAVVALGRWGGREMSYASDADLMFIAADTADPAALRAAGEVVTAMRRLLQTPGPDPGLILDTDLRPEGKDGPVVRTLASYLAYYARWSSTWEAQALVRARHGAGRADLTTALFAAVDPLRYPPDGPTKAQIMEIRRLKGRMEAERLPRGTNPRSHVKLGPGGLADVEWTVQLCQLRHGADIPGLRSTSTLEALEAARAAGCLEDGEAADLAEAWIFASRLRNAITLLRDRPSDVIPGDATQAGQVAEILGYEPGGASHLSHDWGQLALRAKKAVDRRFWGLGE
ncbi:MAG: bifunctional [glutamine synthetase] adenylyltransferase/[glutamine synthetase]-adenylyl-L-tyrosine phosphorylase [Propionibacteriaceae bacterium]|nr:bifunctional [glutamine synthetase] adenylyltransferase/[glutamine synthetase]-adenylyl-L-tyrosine phosphorylase [Propionibacteriaceae bacterium]